MKYVAMQLSMMGSFQYMHNKPINYAPTAPDARTLRRLFKR